MADEMHLRLTAGGDYVTSGLAAEIWECSVSLALVFGSVDPIGIFPNTWSVQATTIARTESDWTIAGNWHAVGGADTFQPDDYLNDQAAPAWTTLMAYAHISNQCRLRYLKLAPIIAPSGHMEPAVPYSTGTPCTLTWTTLDATGGLAPPMLPPQDSVAVSWQTPQVGRHGKGRIYLPPSSGGILSGGKIDSSARDEIAAAGAAFIDALTYSGPVLEGAHVKPVVTGKPWTHYGVIQSVKVGDVMDTQRRRRDRLSEAYHSVNV